MPVPLRPSLSAEHPFPLHPCLVPTDLCPLLPEADLSSQRPLLPPEPELRSFRLSSSWPPGLHPFSTAQPPPSSQRDPAEPRQATLLPGRGPPHRPHSYLDLGLPRPPTHPLTTLGTAGGLLSLYPGGAGLHAVGNPAHLPPAA